MKKMIALLLAAALCCSLTGCAVLGILNSDAQLKKETTEDVQKEPKSPQDKITGTYKADSIEKDGVTLTVAEMEALGDDSMSTAQIVIKDGGKAYISDETGGTFVDWEKDADNLVIGQGVCTIVEGGLCLDFEAGSVFFKKVSDSQEITETESEEVEEADGETAEDLRPEFKEAMDAYEAFMDEYCAFMEKYMANPTDMSLLSDYASYMSDYTDAMAKFDAWESEDLNAAELDYYLEVSLRVSEKLLDAAQ